MSSISASPDTLARHLSYWETTGPGMYEPATDLPSDVDVLIVGGGLAGHWLSYFLVKARPSLRVLVVERDLLGYGASTRNAGFLSCGTISEWLMDLHDQNEELVRRNFASRREGQQIVLRELAGCIAAVHCGSADFDEITEEKSEVARMLNETVGEEIFQRRTAMVGGIPRQTWFNTVDHAINPVQVLGCLHARLLEAGVVFAYGAEVLALDEGRASIRVGSGERDVRYEHGYLCTNAFASELHGASSVVPGRGQIIVTAPLDMANVMSPNLGFMNNGYDYFRPVDGRLLVGGGRHLYREMESSSRLQTTDYVREYLVRLASQLLSMDEVPVEHHWAGIMGFPNGVHGTVEALIGPTWLDSRTEVIAGFAGWGVTLTAYVASRKAAL